MTSRKAEDLHPEMKKIWEVSSVEYVKRFPNNPKPFLTCTHRDNTEQAELYAQGRTTGKLGKIVTNAKPGQSPHNIKPSAAFDVAFKKFTGQIDWNTVLFNQFNAIIQELFPGKVTYGGTFKFRDYPHFELMNWKQLKR